MTAGELIDQLASHSIAVQEDVDPVRAVPVRLHTLRETHMRRGRRLRTWRSIIDTTRSSFDSDFYLETLLRGTVYPSSNPGKVESPTSNEFRGSACIPTLPFPDDQTRMMSHFAAAMEKLAVLGQDAGSLQDCSEVIPPPAGDQSPLARLPGGRTILDLQPSCRNTIFSGSPPN
ncbi:hypothetical protein B0H17DRAFT_1212338 [Mycena rosella]|uniref:Fungal ligninase C-terminal domain-containing protein n=1 Tax=Mycena rosella TaxID=1033263 RepID=A0AAD7CSX6_MYCRO|nr:hypothetical protein B0H17DRAFT_1212338 [Mycena rosella]